MLSDHYDEKYDMQERGFGQGGHVPGRRPPTPCLEVSRESRDHSAHVGRIHGAARQRIRRRGWWRRRSCGRMSLDLQMKPMTQVARLGARRRERRRGLEVGSLHGNEGGRGGRRTGRRGESSRERRVWAAPTHWLAQLAINFRHQQVVPQAAMSCPGAAVVVLPPLDQVSFSLPS